MSGQREHVRLKLEDIFTAEIAQYLRREGAEGVARALFEVFGLECDTNEPGGRSMVVIEVDQESAPGTSNADGQVQEPLGATSMTHLTYPLRDILNVISPNTWAADALLDGRSSQVAPSGASASGSSQQTASPWVPRRARRVSSGEAEAPWVPWFIRNASSSSTSQEVAGATPGATPGAEGDALTGPPENLPLISGELARIYADLSRHGLLHPLRSRVNPERFPILVHDSNSTSIDCIICLEDYVIGVEKRVLTCGHEYHEKCLGKWFYLNTTCPICRRDFIFG